VTARWLQPSRLALLGVLGIYAALAAAVQTHCADLLTSDGECYLRMAESYAKGDFRHAVFGHWSPLGAWLATPLVVAGMAPRVAFRVMLGLWGALCVVGTWRVAARLGMSRRLRTAVAACAALLAAEFSVDHRVDLLLAATLLFYLDAAMDERLLHSRKWALWVGVLGGIAYLAKLYALPFFAAHFTSIVLARAWIESRVTRHASRDDFEPEPTMAHEQLRMPWRRAALAWALGLAGFALVAAPWVAALSAKYGRLTFGTAAATSYALVGPGSGDARTEAITGLHRPPADAPNVWQDALREFPIPKAPAQQAGLAAKLRIAGANAVVILGHIAALDEFRLGLVALALLPVALVWTRRDPERAFAYAAVLLAVGVFCGGYAFIQAANARYFWFVFLVLAAAAFHFVGLVPAWLRRKASEQRLLAVLLVTVAVISFGFHPVRSVADLLRRPPPGREHRLVAQRLREMGIKGPLASLGERGWWNGLHTAYYLDAKYAGTPAARNPKDIVAEMRGATAVTLLVWGDAPMATVLRVEAAPVLEPLGTISAQGGDVAVFRLRPGAEEPR